MTMKKRFLLSGNVIRVLDLDEDAMSDTLPPALYSIEFNPDLGLHLIETENKIVTPVKVYGDVKAQADKIIETYNDRDVSTGVLLTGAKGSGKTMLSTLISSRLLNEGTPIVMVNSKFSGSTFINFVNSLGNCVLLFDEFCKVFGSYNEQDENVESTILTILDGANKQKRLAILIENSAWRVSDYLFDRPGRIWYHFKYKKLSKEVLNDYCESVGVSKKVHKDLLSIRNNMRTFNFDMMKALIEEYKRFGGNLKEHLKVLNIRSKGSDEQLYEIVKFSSNVDTDILTPRKSLVNIEIEDFSISVYFSRKKKATRKKKLTETQEAEEMDRAGYEDNSTYFSDTHIKLDEDNTLVLDNGEYTLVIREVNMTKKYEALLSVTN